MSARLAVADASLACMVSSVSAMLIAFISGRTKGLLASTEATELTKAVDRGPFVNFVEVHHVW